MDIKYKIVEVWPKDLVFVVRYYSDKITEEMLACDDNRRPDGTPVRCKTDVSLDIPLLESDEDREKFFKRMKLISPVDYLKRQEIILENENRFSDIIQTLNSLLDVNQTTTEAEIDDIREESMKPIQTEDDLLEKISEILDQEPKQPATS